MPDLLRNPIVRSFAYTSIFCFGIAILSWLASGMESFGRNFAVSLCIGWSINGAFQLSYDKVCKYVSPYIAPIPIVAVALPVGLFLGGTLVLGKPLYFLATDNATLVFSLFFAIVGFFLFSTYARLWEAKAELAAAEIEYERQERLVAETELRLLQAQIEPHFLFNTLSTITGAIRHEPQVAEKTLLNLTTFLRASLDRTRTETTTLAQELEIAHAYLNIQSTRLGERLHFEIKSDDTLSEVLIPPLLVQPLIENAVKHGIAPKESGGSIIVEAHAEGASLVILVRDDGLGIDSHSPSSGSGTGLDNVRRRIATLYDDAKLSLSEPETGGVLAELRIPLKMSNTQNEV